MNILKIFGATVENLVDRATTRLVFVHPWHMVLYVIHGSLQLHSEISYAPKNTWQVTPQMGTKMDADLQVKWWFVVARILTKSGTCKQNSPVSSSAKYVQ